MYLLPRYASRGMGRNWCEVEGRPALEELSRGRTTITIAHRLTTIKNCDRIFVLDENGIAEEGTHLQLIEKNGEYAKLYSLYNTL